MKMKMKKKKKEEEEEKEEEKKKKKKEKKKKKKKKFLAGNLSLNVTQLATKANVSGQEDGITIARLNGLGFEMRKHFELGRCQQNYS